MARVSQVETDDGISWHVEQSGSGPHLIFIPSGEGDCYSFSNVIGLLSDTFSITAFDLPGFSRSTAPLSAMENLTPPINAKQIIKLLDKLLIPSATLFGPSLGGCIGRALLVHYPERVERLIIHEVPLFPLRPELDGINQLVTALDPQIVAVCQYIFGEVMNEDKAAWEALGTEYHARLEKNYVTWIKKYVAHVPYLYWQKSEVMSKPVYWTVGSKSEMGAWFDNVVLATELGIKIDLLPCRHFPQVSIPEKLAEHIRACVGNAAS